MYVLFWAVDGNNYLHCGDEREQVELISLGPHYKLSSSSLLLRFPLDDLLCVCLCLGVDLQKTALAQNPQASQDYLCLPC